MDFREFAFPGYSVNKPVRSVVLLVAGYLFTDVLALGFRQSTQQELQHRVRCLIEEDTCHPEHVVSFTAFVYQFIHDLVLTSASTGTSEGSWRWR